MKTEERLIVAADYDPQKSGGMEGTVACVLGLAKELKGLGVYIKVNSVLRAAGYQLINRLHDEGLRVFADLKLVDIPSTMKTDATLLATYPPEMLTVMCCAGIDGMHAVQSTLADTKVLGVTVLTSLNEEECQAIFTCSTEAGVLRFARMAKLAGLGELILSPKEVEVVKDRFELGLGLNTPGIRPEWSLVEGDDQSRVLTPAQAIKNGATRIVIGRPIIQAENPREAAQRTLEEIQQGLK
jgi:orotidine-5'-phosphate decarboxylase